MTTDWEHRVAAVWESVRFIDATDAPTDAELRTAIDTLAAERPARDAAALYERASAFDSTGDPQAAVELYEQALTAGLGQDRRRQAVIQLASSLRNLGRAPEAVELLRDETQRHDDELSPQLQGFLALALADAGHEREAVGVAVRALGGQVDRYQRSLRNYGTELVDGA